MQNKNQEAYVALSLDKKTLTFYYDEQRKSRPEKTWGIDERIIEDEMELCAWTGTGDVPNTTITAAEFDASFKNFCPTTTANWFYQLMRLKTIRGWRYLNTSKVEDMNSMFAGCSSLTTLNLSHFDTSMVDDMYQMFCGCNSLTTIYGNSSWNCDDSENMFAGCTSIRGAVAYDEAKTDASMANPETGYFSRK